jgi:hypothetical protein
MKNIFLRTLILTGAIIFLASGCSNDRLADDFVSPPENFRTGAYWYWMNNHISKEGVVNDLKAMKKAGINWVLLGSDIISGNDFGDVKVFSTEWYEIMHTTLKTATELDIDVGLFNCPGWSQSGGPWIKPEQSMRYLASSETRVAGPAKVELLLPKPDGHFQDVKVIAVPVAKDYRQNLFSGDNVRIAVSGNIQKPGPEQEQDFSKYILPDGESFIEITLPQAQPARSLVIYPVRGFKSNIELQAKEGNDYRTVKRFEMDRVDSHNMLLTLGYEPYAPVAVSFPKVKSDVFRIVFRDMQKDSNIKDLMWSDTPVKKRDYGKGLILSDMSMEEVFALLNVTPDFRTTGNAPILYNHRTVDGKEIYFVSNQNDKSITVKPEFRVKGLQPELWDAVTGEIRLLPAYEQKGETTVVPLKLDAYGSAFIVFSKKGKLVSNDITDNYPEPVIRVPVNSEWQVRFESDAVKRGPSETVTFTELKDWSQSDDERIKYYSGTAVYTTQFSVEDNVRGKKWYLDLGKVSVMAKVKINGEYAGGVWTAPYRLNVTKYLKQDDNTLEIEAVNTWVNRIIGDLNLPKEQRKVKPNYNSWRADSPLQSGFAWSGDIIEWR